MKRIRRSIAITIAALMFLALAACTDGGTTPSGDGSPPAGNSSSPNLSANVPEGSNGATGQEEEEEEFNGAAFMEEYYKKSSHDFGGEEFIIYAWWSSAFAEGSEQEAELNKVAEKYNCSAIKWLYPCEMSQMSARILTDEAAGTQANVCWLPISQFVPLAAGGYLATIDEVDYKSMVTVIDPFTEAFYYNGHQYGIVTGNHPEGLLYNRTLIQKYGFEDPQELFLKGEWTWDKFREICIGVMKDNNTRPDNPNYGLLAGWDMEWSGGMLPLLYTNGSGITKNVDGKIVQNFDDPRTMEALQFLSDLINVDMVCGPDRETIERYATIAPFAKGNIAFMVGGGAVMETYMHTAEHDFVDAFVTYPRGPQAAQDFTPQYFISGTVFPSKKDPVGAVEVYKAYLDVENVISAKLLDGSFDDEGIYNHFFGEKTYLRDKSLIRYCNPELEADIPTVRQMFSTVVGVLDAGYGMDSIITDMMSAIGTGMETPASAVAARVDKLQAAIDAKMGG